MEENRKKLLIKSVVIGSVVGSIFVTVKSKSKCYSPLKNSYKKTKHILNFINDHRSEIVSHLKTNSSKITKAIDDTNADLQAIAGNIKHLKDSSAQVISAVHETKDSLVSLYQTCSHKLEARTISELESNKDA